MMKTATIALLASLTLITAGCASKQKAAPPAPIATDTPIVLSVSDARDGDSIVLQTGGDTTGITDVNLMRAVEKSVRAAFFEKGYRLVSENDSHVARVDVALRAFHLEVAKKLLVAETEQTSTTLIVEVRRGGKTMKRTYTAGAEKRALKYSADIRKKIAAALDKALAQVVRDRELERFITGS